MDKAIEVHTILVTTEIAVPNKTYFIGAWAINRAFAAIVVAATKDNNTVSNSPGNSEI